MYNICDVNNMGYCVTRSGLLNSDNLMVFDILKFIMMVNCLYQLPGHMSLMDSRYTTLYLFDNF